MFPLNLITGQKYLLMCHLVNFSRLYLFSFVKAIVHLVIEVITIINQLNLIVVTIIIAIVVNQVITAYLT